MPLAARILPTALALAALTGCVTGQKHEGPKAPPLSLADVTAHLPSSVQDPDGWARDIDAAIRALDKDPTAERVCATVAVIEQESRFHADPAVAHLPQIVRTALTKKLSPLGPLAGPALTVFLSGKAPGAKETFGQRLDHLKTEHDLDRLFRDIEATYKGGYPGPFAIASELSKLFGPGALEDMNPVTTVGAMQVKVSYAQLLPETKGMDEDDVREYLYTRAGGVRAGVARLLGYSANYDDVLYRFADYNAGPYASRNAAFQQMLADLTGQTLAFDGDILAYGPDGEPLGNDSKTLHAMLTFGRMHGDWAWLIRRAAKKEKEEAFEDTSIYKDVREAWEKSTGKKAPYARIPEIPLTSPKMERARSTGWFAESVKRHYDECRKR